MLLHQYFQNNGGFELEKAARAKHKSAQVKMTSDALDGTNRYRLHALARLGDVDQVVALLDAAPDAAKLINQRDEDDRTVELFVVLCEPM